MPPREAAALAAPYRSYVERTARRADAPWHAGTAVRPVLLLGCGEADGSEAAALHEFARDLADAQVAMVPAASPPACWSAPRFFVLEAERFLAAYA
jgi:hypothetical protein